MIDFSNNDISSTFVPSPNCNPILTEKCASVFEKSLNSNKINIIDPPRTNERLERQKGVFIIPGSFNSNDFKNLLVKNSTIVDINPSCRFELLNYLNKIEYNSFFLMPDLSNICNEIKKIYEHNKTL